MVEEIELTKALAFDSLGFMDDTNYDEDRIVLRQIREYQLATEQWTRNQRLQFYLPPMIEPPIMSRRDLTTLSEAEISRIWCPTSNDARLGVHCNPEANWRPHMEPYSPSIDVLHTREKVLPLYHENASYPRPDSLPYFRGLQRHTNSPEPYMEFQRVFPHLWIDTNRTNLLQRYAFKPTRVPPGFERYLPRVNVIEASGDNNARSDIDQYKMAEASN